MNIYIGNIPYSVTEDELKAVFEEYGEVNSVKIIKNKHTGKSKGFGFVILGDSDGAGKAIEELDGHELNGRSLRVLKAKEQPQLT